MVYCTNCGAENPAGAHFCKSCGATLPDSSRPAATASHEELPVIDAEVVSGPPPGQPYNAQGPPPPYADPLAKSKIVAGLLGVFFGWLGVHRFYLGFTNTGIIQLLLGLGGLLMATHTCFFSLIGTAIATLWGIAEGIMILLGIIHRDAQGRPIRD